MMCLPIRFVWPAEYIVSSTYSAPGVSVVPKNTSVICMKWKSARAGAAGTGAAASTAPTTAFRITRDIRGILSWVCRKGAGGDRGSARGRGEGLLEDPQAL